MIEKIAVAIVSSEWFMLAVIGIAVKWLAAWFLSATGMKWKKYEGWAITAVKAAEKAIPNDVANKGLARFDKAMRLFLEKYTAATGVPPNEADLVGIENLINIVHERLEKDEAI